MNVLVVAPHPDDESIGCGGAVITHADDGDSVTAVFMTSGDKGLTEQLRRDAPLTREAEAAAAASILGIGRLEFLRQPDWRLCEHVDAAVSGLTQILADTAAEIVYVPHPADAHPDHRAAAVVTRRAIAVCERPPRVRAYEVWTPLPRYDVCIDVGPVLDRKLAAIRCHLSQRENRDFARAARSLSEYRAALDGRYAHAEVFATLETDASWWAPADVRGWAPPE